MPRRTPETLADYLVVAICPALIMLLVGSLLFFLVEVSYQGQFELRLLFVLAMFVLAIVCLARIAMEEGYAYASLYAVPLGVLVGIALTRFVRIEGLLAPYSLLVNWGLMAWVWWCAHKLTWDCTLIDDSQDASGEGLLQQMGLDQEATAPAPEASAAAPEAVAGSPADDDATAWWGRWLEPDRRPHPPGVWVVYFSLGALPLFGIGGRFLAADNLESRRWCFWLLVIYVASALSLLLATSFLGLRKYLRQRRLEMPLEMAAAWVGAGLMLILATIVVAALVPRPSPEYSVAQLVKFDSPERWASRWGVGPEGAKSKPGSSPQGGTPEREGQKADQQGGGKTDPQNKNGSPSKSGQNKGAGKGEQSKSGQSQSNQSQSSESQSSESQSSESQSSESQQSQSSSKPSPSNSTKSEQTSRETQTRSPQQPDRQSDQPPNDGDQQQGKQAEPSDGNSKSSQNGSTEQQPTQQSDSTQNEKGEKSSQEPSSNQQPSNDSSENSSAPTQRIFEHLQTVVSWMGGLFKTIFYLALALVTLVLAWWYRAELLAAWKKLLAELADLWGRWFGKEPGRAAEVLAEVIAPPRPFAAFADPFASGQAARMSPAEVVRYTFLALEAWGRESGCPRAVGQTPHEFAAAIGQLDASLAREAAHLADLYARMAYAQPAAIRTSFDPLRALWQKMQSPAVTVV